MRVLHAYAKGDPTRLVLEEAPIPSLAADEVLVRVVASGVSPAELDWPGAWLGPDGAPRDLPIIPGHEVAGVVAAIGPAATSALTVGDGVFGLLDFRRDGADAEYVAVRAAELAPKPSTATFVEAAAVPLSALTAWQSLFDQGGLAAGERVLIHGGAGGVGSFAVQLARWRGAHVIATSSGRDAEMVRDLGADTVIDYRAQRFEAVVRDLDLVVDTVGGDTWERSWDVLAPAGRLVSVAVPRPPEREVTDGRRATWFVVRADRGHLTEIAALIDGGAVRPIVSAVLPLAAGAGAYGSGAHRGGPGKVVLRVADEPDPVGARTTPKAAASVGTDG